MDVKGVLSFYNQNTNGCNIAEISTWNQFTCSYLEHYMYYCL